MKEEEQDSSRNDRIEREIKTIRAMIGIYCSRKHHGKDLCPDCRDLLAYAIDRLGQCPFGAVKPPCKECRIHCYKKEYRRRIREVMSFAGPLMPFYHPIMAVRHIIDGFGKKAP